MLAPLQLHDISQYCFEEFCEKWAFELYERAVSDKFNDDGEEFWKDFHDIEPDIYLDSYMYITSLGTKVVFTPSSDSRYEIFWTYRVINIKTRY